MAKGGDKRRLEEQSTKLRSLRIAIIVAVVVHAGLGLGIFRRSASKGQWFGFIVTTAVELICYNLLAAMAAPKFGSSGELLSGGADFSDGAEFYFDAIYLSIVAQVGSILSRWFWLVLLAAPLYLCYQLWQNLVRPYLAAQSSPAQEESEAQRLKRQKAERRQQRRARI